MTSKEAINRALTMLNWNYIYGFKHKDNPVKLATINNLRSMYSSVFTDSYTEKAKKMIGKNAIDCSGLVCFTWNIADIGSWNIHDLPTKNNAYFYCDINGPIPIGSCVWKTGHVGICIGDGKVIEARGIDYGVVITKLSERGWMKVIAPKFDQEIQVDYENLGWNKDGIGWWYAYGTTKGDFYKDTIAIINGKPYAFDENGYNIKSGAFKSDDDGSIISVRKEDYNGA